MEKESEIQLLEALDQLEVCFSECVSKSFIYASCGVVILYTERNDLTTNEQVFALDLVHTTPDKFKTAALYLELGIPSTLVLHENRVFWKRPSNRRNLKPPALRFSMDGKHI